MVVTADSSQGNVDRFAYERKVVEPFVGSFGWRTLFNVVWPVAGWAATLAKSKLYLLTSDPLSGDEAERIGLASLAVPHDNLMTVARDYAERLAHGPKYAIRYIKRALNQWLRLGGITSHDYSSALELMNFLGPELGDAVENAETNDDH